VFVVRRDLPTGTESRIAQLHANPNLTTVGWTAGGALEVYTTSVPRPNDRWLEQVHLWARGADHILYSFEAGPGGFEGRWSAALVLEFSPNHSYVSISDTNYSPQNYNVRIFSVADRSQKLVSGTQGLAASGGTWVTNDRYVWASGAGKLMQWTPTGGATVLRSESWFTPASSSDGRWLAGTLLTDTSKPRVLMSLVGTSKTFLTRGLASSPGFVSPSVVWYAEERALTGGSFGTWPDSNVHAFNLTNGSDRLVVFRAGEKPVISNGNTMCCSTHG
jgi:hypothetical protein